jgi:hypothetical protein
MQATWRWHKNLSLAIMALLHVSFMRFNVTIFDRGNSFSHWHLLLMCTQKWLFGMPMPKASHFPMWLFTDRSSSLREVHHFPVPTTRSEDGMTRIFRLEKGTWDDSEVEGAACDRRGVLAGLMRNLNSVEHEKLTVLKRHWPRRFYSMPRRCVPPQRICTPHLIADWKPDIDFASRVPIVMVAVPGDRYPQPVFALSFPPWCLRFLGKGRVVSQKREA